MCATSLVSFPTCHEREEVNYVVSAFLSLGGRLETLRREPFPLSPTSYDAEPVSWEMLQTDACMKG